MAYEKTRQVMQEKGVSADDLQEILSAYADETEETEPHATVAINAARNIALDLFD